MNHKSVGVEKGLKDPADDVKNIRAAIEGELEQGNDVIIVMHSYGGVPSSNAAEGLGKKDRKAAGKSNGIVNMVWVCVGRGFCKETFLQRIRSAEVLLTPKCVVAIPSAKIPQSFALPKGVTLWNGLNNTPLPWFDMSRSETVGLGNEVGVILYPAFVIHACHEVLSLISVLLIPRAGWGNLRKPAGGDLLQRLLRRTADPIQSCSASAFRQVGRPRSPSSLKSILNAELIGLLLSDRIGLSSTFDLKVEYEAYKRIPSSYLICDKDNAIPQAAQVRLLKKLQDCGGLEPYTDFADLSTLQQEGMIKGAGPEAFQIVEHLDASHSPFISKPGALAEFLLKVADKSA